LIFFLLDVRALKILVGLLILTVTALLIMRDRDILGAAAGATQDAMSSPPAPALITGAASGIMTALLVMPGPPLMLYLASAALPKAESRALSLSVFAVCYVFVALLNIASGTLTASAWQLIGLLSPAVVVGTLFGTRASAWLSERAFRNSVFALLIASGIGALVSALG
jgi:uncharacterized protein